MTPKKFDVIVGPSEIAGKGCFAARDFAKGEIIGEYTGEIVDDDEADRRYEEADHIWLFDIGEGKYIDASSDSNPIKYINHCCTPNCESETEEERVFVRAIRAIKAGEELSYDYNLQVDEEDDDPHTCCCATVHCRGTMRAAS